MAQNLIIAGATFNDVPSVDIPISGGGTAKFVDTSDANAVAGDILSGKSAYVNGVKINGTGSGGGTLGTKNITENGTYAASDDNLDGYSSVVVDVAGSGVLPELPLPADWSQDSFTLDTDYQISRNYTIPSGKALTIPAGKTLKITNVIFKDSGTKITNNGVIECINGNFIFKKIDNYGEIKAYGIVTFTGTANNRGNISIYGNLLSAIFNNYSGAYIYGALSNIMQISNRSGGNLCADVIINGGTFANSGTITGNLLYNHADATVSGAGRYGIVLHNLNGTVSATNIDEIYNWVSADE